jgi:hypothetical protein
MICLAVTVAESGAQALEVLQRSLPGTFQLILTVSRTKQEFTQQQQLFKHELSTVTTAKTCLAVLWVVQSPCANHRPLSTHPSYIMLNQQHLMWAS